MNNRLKILLLIVIIIILSSSLCREIGAHPHIWIDTEVRFFFTPQKLTRIEFTYIFDEMYSTTVFSQVDTNNNDQIDPQEMDGIKKEVLSHIEGDSCFIHLKVNQKEVSVGGAELFKAFIDQEERLVVVLNIPCQFDVSDIQQTVAVSAYDKEYYYEVMNPIKESISIEGSRQINHVLFFQEDRESAYYFEQFYPLYTVVKFKKL
ncbi:MAG: DUF1007 family protein [Candidatus Omnitrophica bacterium]|nr:DUF1007 family protein [Candidatus Omnitrophota bacterium]